MSTLSRLDAFLEDRSAESIRLIAVILIGFIGVLDFLTGYEFSFSIFYLLPVSLAAWYDSDSSGAVMSAISMITWLSVDLLAGHVYSHPLFPVWNAMVRLAFFLITSRLLSTVRKDLVRESEAARMDGLTGLLNNRAFFEQGERIVRMESRSGHMMTIAFLDLDDFKRINDTVGHEEGDRVLRSIAAGLRDATRTSDLVARLGGDEFVVLLPSAGHDESDAVLDRIGARLELLRWGDGNDVGASLGAVSFDPSSTTLAEAIKAADDVMYEVKREGKGSIRHKRLDG